MRLAAGTRWWSYSAPPDPLAVIRGEEGGKRKEMVGNREGRKGREGKDVNGEEGTGREGKG